MSVLAFDLGASSGRAIVGWKEKGVLHAEEVHRFHHAPVQKDGHMHWDVYQMVEELKTGLKKALQSYTIDSVAIDTWAVDFGLLNEEGELIQLPYHYRDEQTDGMMEEVRKQIPDEELFQKTGIQFMQINTIYHLYAMKRRDEPALKKAHTFLMLPDLLRYFLTGEKYSEFTNVTTTQLFNPVKGEWDTGVMKKLDLPTSIFLSPVQPGTHVGNILPEICEEVGAEETIPVYTIGEHDTASAVVSCPSDREPFAYLSCGTWSLMGTETDQALLTEEARKFNMTNEGGVDHTFRLLKNIMGLWIAQQSVKQWKEEGQPYTFEEQERYVREAAPFRTFINPNDQRFLNPDKMVEEVKGFAEETGQPVPESAGEVLRCILESLAFKYRETFEKLETLTNQTFPVLHMFGGGIQNEQLCQLTANAVNKTVVAGPVEASSFGNILVQLQSLGEIESVKEGRRLVRNSVPVQEFVPYHSEQVDEAYHFFLKICEG